MRNAKTIALFAAFLMSSAIQTSSAFAGDGSEASTMRARHERSLSRLYLTTREISPRAKTYTPGILVKPAADGLCEPLGNYNCTGYQPN